MLLLEVIEQPEVSVERILAWEPKYLTVSIPPAVKYCTEYGSLMPNIYLKQNSDAKLSKST